MREPRRLRDDDNVSAEMRAVLRPGRTGRLPDAVRERSAARLDRALVLPAAAGVLFWLKGVALATGVVLVGVVGPRALSALLGPVSPSIAVAPPSTPAPIAAHPRAPSPPVLPIPPVVPAASAAPATVKPTSPPVATRDLPPSEPPVDPLTREASMLEQARAAMAHDPGAALALLDAHRAAFPDGSLALERELVAVDALSRLGRTSEARGRGEALRVAARGSIYEGRVAALLEALRNR